MYYQMDFAGSSSLLLGETPRAGNTEVTDEIALSPLEAVVVEIGCKDASRTGWDASFQPSRTQRIKCLFRSVTGARSVTPLADERLELLRLLACTIRRNDPRSEGLIQRLVDRGMKPAALVEAISRASMYE